MKKTVSLSFLSDIYTFLCPCVYCLLAGIIRLFVAIIFFSFPIGPSLQLFSQFLFNESAQVVSLKWKSLPFIGAARILHPVHWMDCARQYLFGRKWHANGAYLMDTYGPGEWPPDLSVYLSGDYLLICITARCYSLFTIWPAMKNKLLPYIPKINSRPGQKPTVYLRVKCVLDTIPIGSIRLHFRIVMRQLPDNWWLQRERDWPHPHQIG